MVRIAVCDDEYTMQEELAHEISNHLQKRQIPFKVQKFSSGEALLTDTQAYDLLFLDIKMSGINGMETARRLRDARHACHIIFITALRDYVFEAFDVEADNFLVKPVDRQKLFHTLDKTVDHILHEEHCFLTIHQGGTFQKLRYRDIMYCEARDHAVNLYLKDAEQKYLGKIDELQAQLTSDFFRCHRSYLVNFLFIERYSQGWIHLANGEKLPLAKRRKQDFLDALLQYHRKEVR